MNSAVQLRHSFDVQVEDLELRAAIAGDLTRRPHAQQWAGAFGAAAGQPEQLFYFDAEVSRCSINVLSPRRDLHCPPSTSSAGKRLDSPRKAAQRRSVSLQGSARSNRWLPQVSGKRSSCDGGRTSTTTHIIALIPMQGDHNNVVYGSLYRMDLASYSRHDPLKTSAGARPRFGYAYASRCFCVPSPLSYQQASLSRVACMHALCNAGVQPCVNRTHLPCR